MVKNLLSVMAALLVAGHTLSAHHSFAAEYDGTKPVKSDRHRQASGVGKSSHLVLRRRQG
jgi:hypothetical protein